MKINILSLGQLLKKGYDILMKIHSLLITYSLENLIGKVPNIDKKLDVLTQHSNGCG